MAEQLTPDHPDTRHINAHSDDGDIVGKAGRSEPAVLPVHDMRGVVFRPENEMPEHAAEPISDRDLQIAYMLLAWVAEEWNATPETAQRIAKIRFGVDDVTKLTRRDYEDLTKMLVDLYIADCDWCPQFRGGPRGYTKN